MTARIARVETAVGSGEVGVRAAEESRTQSPRQPAQGTIVSPRLDGGGSEPDRSSVAPAALCDQVEEPELALAVMGDREARPDQADARELIPAAQPYGGAFDPDGF